MMAALSGLLPALQVSRLAPVALLLVTLAFAACGDDPVAPDSCDTQPLPLRGTAANAPTVIDVTLDVQPEGIVVLATATDPQGDVDLVDVQQTVRLFREADCSGDGIALRDDLAGSGLEESFGTAVSAAADRPLYDRIVAVTTWPVEVDFVDRGGNRTTGRVLAPVRR